MVACYPIGRIKYREHSRAACDTIASTRRRFCRMDGSTPWPAATRPGGRQKGTPNKATVRLAAKFAEAAERATAGLSPSEFASMMPLDVMLFVMRLELEGGRWRSAASIAEKAAPYVHPKMAPRAEEGGDHELTIKVIGGLPE